jgi:hypothetical protein
MTTQTRSTLGMELMEQPAQPAPTPVQPVMVPIQQLVQQMPPRPVSTVAPVQPSPVQVAPQQTSQPAQQLLGIIPQITGIVKGFIPQQQSQPQIQPQQQAQPPVQQSQQLQPAQPAQQVIGMIPQITGIVKGLIPKQQQPVAETTSAKHRPKNSIWR